MTSREYLFRRELNDLLAKHGATLSMEDYDGALIAFSLNSSDDKPVKGITIDESEIVTISTGESEFFLL